jgi:Ca2+-binding RTX toxin-like protein
MPTTLVAGDIAFTAVQADNTGGGFNGDAFEFLLLVPVTVGTTIFFTDNGYLTSTSAFRTNENLVRWVAQSDLPAGTVKTFLAPGGTGAASTAEWTGINPTTGATLTTAAMGLAGGGDNIHALQSPTFGGAELLNGTAIAAITWGGATFAATFTTASGNATTALAPGLTDGVNAVSIAATDNARYNDGATGSVEAGSAATIRSSINNDANWTASTNPLSPHNTTATFLITTPGADTLTGTSGDDTIDLLSGNDSFNGGAGNDSITGGTGNDTLTGGTGADTFVRDANDTVAQADVITDFSLADGDKINLGTTGPASWLALKNLLIGTNGTDAQLQGMWNSNAQTVTLTGVTQEAIKLVNNATSAPNFTFDTSGTSRNITGTSGNDMAFGGLGADTLSGGLGNDTLWGDDGADVMDGGDGNDSLFGGAGADSITGGTNNDRLYGDAGTDTLTGGTGADVYYIDDTTDVIVEASGEGYDLIQSSSNYVLAAGVSIEGLSVRNVAGASLTGNELDQSMNGYFGSDTLNGGGGNDIIDGGAGADSMLGGLGDDTFYVNDAGDAVSETAGEGTDLVWVSAASWIATAGASVETIRASASGLSITGNELNNNIYGTTGADILDGGAGNDRLYSLGGADTLSGGMGNDIFYVTSTTAVVREASGAGIDYVQTTVDFTIGSGQEIEAVQITSAAGRSVTGNELADELRGNTGNDSLSGGAGNDDLYGGDGADLLDGGIGNDRFTGGAGADTFSFSTGWGKDFIIDFQDNVDKIDLTGVAGLESFSQLTVTMYGANDMLLSFEGNTLRVRGDLVTASSIADDVTV